MLFNKYINKYYLKYWLPILLGLSALIIVDVAQLFIPRFLGQIVDTINGKLNLSINEISLKVLIVAVVLFLGRMTFRLAIFNTSTRIESNLRSDLFKKATSLSPSFYHYNPIGTIMTWFTSDLETLEEFLAWGTVMLVDATFLCILVVIYMLQIDWVLSIICFIPMLLLVVWGLLAEKIMVKKWDYRQKSFDKVYDYSQETFTGIRVIKAFVKENQEIKYFSKIAKKNSSANVSFARTTILFEAFIEIIIATALCLLLGFGGWFVYSYISYDAIKVFGHTIKMTTGDLVTFVGYFNSLIWPMIAMGRIVAMRSRAKASLKRVAHFLDTKDDVKNPENPIILNDVNGKIEFRGFNFKYPDGDVDALENINITINPGERIGVIGRVGSGKTTLINSLFRLYNINENTLFIDDNDLMKCDIKSIRENICYVPQDNFLFSDEIKNNIAFSNVNISFDKIKEAAKFADVDENIEGFKEGYNTITGERGVTLSGGQKQRISIARAYLKDSPIMILDDSVSAVDVKTEEAILHNIKEYRKGKTTILIASRVSTVINMDKIIVLNDGKLEAFDTPEALKQTSETFKNMIYLQSLMAEVEGGSENE